MMQNSKYTVLMSVYYKEKPEYLSLSIESFLLDTFTIENVLKFIAFNESPLKGHLWYLGAILYVLIIMHIFDKLKIEKCLVFAAPFLLMGDLILGKYSVLLLGREFPYILVCNFLFVGIPYFCIGRLIRSGFGQKESLGYFLDCVFCDITA